MTQRLDFYKSNPAAIKAMGCLEERIAHSSLEKPLIELVRLRVSQINGCAYCVDLHSTQAVKLGDSERRVHAMPVWSETPFFTDRERAAFLWAEALTRLERTHVPDEVWEKVKPHFTPEDLVDLTLLVNTINAWNRFAIAFRKLPV